MFQEKTGKRTFKVNETNIIEHKLPIVGSYFYIPRGLVMEHETWNMEQLINLAIKEKSSWVRIDLKNSDMLETIKKNTKCKIKKSPHDMQPKEIFVIDITVNEEELLSSMKQKTRYNLKLAERKNIKISNHQHSVIGSNHVDEFLRLVKATAERKGVRFHPENYYRKMIEIIPENILKLYCAEYNNKVIAANLVAFYGDTATYLHGATDDEYRNVMAPYLLQWQAIKDAKNMGCTKYDFGGVKTGENNNWSGITKFKLGFSQNTKPIVFSGSYDIVINPVKYWMYRIIQKVKSTI